MVWAECKLAEARCRRRRLRPMVMKLPCSLWFLLLFGAGGMVLFTHLQDLSETFQQQAPGRDERQALFVGQGCDGITCVLHMFHAHLRYLDSLESDESSRKSICFLHAPTSPVYQEAGLSPLHLGTGACSHTQWT